MDEYKVLVSGSSIYFHQDLQEMIEDGWELHTFTTPPTGNGFTFCALMVKKNK